jgi:hypothetical protein
LFRLAPTLLVKLGVKTVTKIRATMIFRFIGLAPLRDIAFSVDRLKCASGMFRHA